MLDKIIMNLDTFNCPHCEAKNKTDEWTENWTFDGDEFEVKCFKCKDYFDIRVYVSVQYELVEG